MWPSRNEFQVTAGAGSTILGQARQPPHVHSRQRIVRAGFDTSWSIMTIEAEVALGGFLDGEAVKGANIVAFAVFDRDHADRIVGAVVRTCAAADAGGIVDDHLASLG